MTFSEQIAVRTIWGEARGEPQDGQRAVAHVLVNRQKSGRWGKTLATVSLWPLQFSCWNSSDPNRKQMAALSDDDPLLQRFADFLQAAVLGGPDPTNGATHYYAASMTTPPAWIQGATQCAKIGNHYFYKDVR